MTFLPPWRLGQPIPLGQAAFPALGFAACDPAVRTRLERVLETFLFGYNLALTIADPEEVSAALVRELDAHHLGFAFEGAGMRYAVCDLLAPWRPSRLRAFLDGPGRDHDYIAAVGAGLAVARLPWGRRLWARYSRRLDPLVAWCLPDGWGFHEGIFRSAPYLSGRAAPPAALPAFARQLFDSGLGRSLWWSQGAEPLRIARILGGFPAARQPEMWCGVGVAAAYAGGAGEGALLALRELAGRHRADFLSGVPFAARMRQKGRNPSPVTDRACALLLGCSADDAGDWLTAVVERVLADPGLAPEVRLRDSYLLVRRLLVEGLHNLTQGDASCPFPGLDRPVAIASS